MTALARINKSLAMVLLFCLVLFAALPSRADTIDETDTSATTTDNLVPAYYNRCLNTVYQDMAPETRQEFCACTSAHIKDALRRSELVTMATGKGPPVDPKTLALKVMAPCLAAPLEEVEYNACMGDPTYVHFFKTADAFNTECHCVSAGMADYVQTYGSDLLAYQIQMDPSSADNPANSLSASSGYVTERAKLHNKCLNENAGH